MIQPPSRTTLVACFAALSLAWFAGGCEREPIRAYDAPKAPPEPEMSAAPPSPMPMRGGDSGNSGPVGLDWAVPEGWTDIGGDQSTMRFATFRAGDGDGAVEVAITHLQGQAGGWVANVNRWRAQVGAEQLPGEELRKTVTLYQRSDGPPAFWVDVTGKDDSGNPAQLIAVYLRDEEADITWFVKAQAAPEVIAPHREAIIKFGESIRFLSEPSHAAEAPQQQAAVGQPQWQDPKGWLPLEELPTFAVAGYVIQGATGEARVAVTPLRGLGGGMLPNVNRWRGQVGLQPVASLEEQMGSRLTVSGARAAALFDLKGPDEENFTQRMLVAVIVRDDFTWFIKLTGDLDVMADQIDTFKAFVESIKFVPGGHP